MSTKIEWCTETWNPIVGCSRVSPGCDHCYAERMAKRLACMGIEGYAEVLRDSGDGWSGKQYFKDVVVLKPLSWKKPRMIFVCSMGDLFHSEVPFIWVDKVMAIAALRPMHTFILLTKRPLRMKIYFEMGKDILIGKWEDAIYEMGLCDKNEDPDAPACYMHNRLQDEWPIKNVWLGVTAENQMKANERVPILLSIPAAKRFVSVEPMLSQIDLVNVYGDAPWTSRTQRLGYIEWVICGGESSPGARPMNPEWVRFLQAECRCASVPFFFKQWGEWLPSYDFGTRLDEFPGFKPNEKNQHEFKDGIHMCRVGKKAAGALLDGKEYKEYPKS